jgi:hypothetical protein
MPIPYEDSEIVTRFNIAEALVERAFETPKQVWLGKTTGIIEEARKRREAENEYRHL